jgi:hypothetical protein
VYSCCDSWKSNKIHTVVARSCFQLSVVVRFPQRNSLSPLRERESERTLKERMEAVPVVPHFGGLSKIVCVYHQAQKVKVFQRNFLGSKLVSSYGNSSSSMLLLENGQHLLRSFGALSRWQKHRPVAATARRKQDDGQSRYTPPVKERKSDPCRQKLLQKAFESATSTILATGAAAAILLQTCSSAAAESLTVTFPGSSIGEVNNVQRTLVEAWGIVRETYVDPTFNNQDWDLKLEEVLGETLSLKTSDAAYAKIRSMLATLGDPFTRIVNPQEYESFRISNEGALEGVGLLIASDRDSGRLVVLSPIEGGPAARAGIISGDELVQIDDQALAGMNNEEVATRLRGRAGTSVTLKLRRPVCYIQIYLHIDEDDTFRFQ